MPEPLLPPISVDASCVDRTGFFCCMSKRKSEGYRRKLDWLKARFPEGLRLRLLPLPERGFIEYVPGEHAWRAVRAEGYMVIHCLWVVGRSKGKGYGRLLLEACLRDAREEGLRGVAMVASEGNWLAGKEILLRQGFEEVDRAPPSFTLLALRFRDGPGPSFPRDWEDRRRRFGRGLTILRTDQCPYLDDATRVLVEAAEERGIASRVIELRTRNEVQELSPAPYGAFHAIQDGRLLSYHYLTRKQFLGHMEVR